MSERVLFDVDPATLHLPNARIDGADPAKLQRQIARHGRSLAGMPPVLVYRGSDGELMLSDGVPAQLALPSFARDRLSLPNFSVLCLIQSVTSPRSRRNCHERYSA